MNHTLDFGNCYCYAKNFTINGIRADSDDFGEQCDRSPETAADHCCGDMHFTPKDSTPEILAKYNITKTDYDFIASKLEDGLSFGACGYCE